MLNPNHRILIVDDNPAIHEDFRKILCPTKSNQSEVRSLKATLFDKAPMAATPVNFELVSAFQGQEAFALIRQSIADKRPFAMVFLAGPIGGIVGGPISAAIMTTLAGKAGLAGWQWMFLVEGLPCIVLGIATFLYLPDRRRTTRRSGRG